MTTPKKRRHPRVEMEIPADLFESSGAKKVHVGIANLGPDGAFVKTENKLDAGASVKIQFKVPSYPLGFDITAEVLWQRDGAGGGIGIRFSDTPNYERAALDDFCQQRLVETRGFAEAGPGA